MIVHDRGLLRHGGRLWQAVMAVHGPACVLCGAAEFLAVDHVVPWSKGGRTFLDNLQPLCGRCNRSKANRMPAEWLALIQVEQLGDPDRRALVVERMEALGVVVELQAPEGLRRGITGWVYEVDNSVDVFPEDIQRRINSVIEYVALEEGLRRCAKEARNLRNEALMQMRKDLKMSVRQIADSVGMGVDNVKAIVR